MIPKIIHYCWFGGATKPASVIRCINSWKKNCPGYKIIEWNETNFDISSCPQYVRDAYDNKKWAFATDFIRLKIVYEHGGVYFDTDVELIRSIDRLTQYGSFFGFENREYINTGIGFGAVKGTRVLAEMMSVYEGMQFILPDGTYNSVTCPVVNTQTLLNHGLIQNNKKQLLEGNIMILPSVCMCPIDYGTGIMKKKHKTISIHWFDASWMSADDKEYHLRHQRKLKDEKIDYWKHMPNRVVRYILGSERYSSLKKRLKK